MEIKITHIRQTLCVISYYFFSTSGIYKDLGVLGSLSPVTDPIANMEIGKLTISHIYWTHEQIEIKNHLLFFE